MSMTQYVGPEPRITNSSRAAVDTRQHPILDVSQHFNFACSSYTLDHAGQDDHGNEELKSELILHNQHYTLAVGVRTVSAVF